MHKIPLIDLRDKTLVDLCQQEKSRGIALLDATKDSFGTMSRLASYIAFPIGDKLAKKLLKRTKNPYAQEIDQIAETLGVRGVHALNLSYEWGCTSGVFKTKDGPQLVRVLDWPFPGLGENTVVARQTSEAGEYYNITWPGVAGIFQAMAPDRFAIALNQAPLRKRGAGIAYDWLHARFVMYKQDALPPAHLLRHVFETAKNYDEAKRLLSETPVSIPVIYILSGIKDNEGCVIERTERSSYVRELAENDNVAAANHFSPELESSAKSWRMRGLWRFRGVDSYSRSSMMCGLKSNQFDDNFDWFKYPVANHLTRLVVVTSASSKNLKVIGTNAEVPATEVFKL